MTGLADENPHFQSEVGASAVAIAGGQLAFNPVADIVRQPLPDPGKIVAVVVHLDGDVLRTHTL